jgi:hypothetical protein
MTMAEGPQEKRSVRERLVVTGPTRERLYELFRRLFAGRDDVEVIKDRRWGQRRRRAVTPESERRARDRRECSPHTIGPPDPPA